MITANSTDAIEIQLRRLLRQMLRQAKDKYNDIVWPRINEHCSRGWDNHNYS